MSWPIYKVLIDMGPMPTDVGFEGNTTPVAACKITYDGPAGGDKHEVVGDFLYIEKTPENMREAFEQARVMIDYILELFDEAGTVVVRRRD